jgi:hypothetical protein
MTEVTGFGLGGRFAPIWGVAALSFALSACVQSTATNSGADQPAVTAVAPATSDPVLLSGAAFANADPTTTASVNAAAPAANPAPAPVSAPPVVASKPVPAAAATSARPPAAQEPAVAQASQPLPEEAEEFPNVNIPPRQPDGKLLTPEERAKLIAELNALATRQTGGN